LNRPLALLGMVALYSGATGCSLAVGIDDECAGPEECPALSTCASGLCVPLPTTRDCTVQADCPTGEACAEGRCFVLPRQSVTEDIDVSTTWTDDRVYVLEDTIYVRPGAVLTVEAGTQVIAGADRAALIVDNGRLDVRGTREAPVVFTSAEPPGSRSPGDWGGIALVGDAPVNVDPADGRPALEGIEPPLPYGGNDSEHICGTLTYLRIEFAGFVLAANQELNGLTLAGCGSGTLVDYVQVHKGNDDGIELFGGGANIKHAVITDPVDDGLDWDQGWQGNAQFVIVRQTDADKNGIEADNNEDGGDLLPRSSPEVFNLTVIGTRDPRHPNGAVNRASIGATLRRGTAGRIANAIFTNQGAFPLVVSGFDSQECALAFSDPGEGFTCAADPGESTQLELRAALFHQTTSRTEASLFPVEEDGAVEAFRHSAWTSSVAVTIDIGRQDLLVDPFFVRADGTGPRFYPFDGAIPNEIEPVTPPAEEFFDGTADFIGAVANESRDWTRGWTAYPEN